MGIGQSILFKAGCKYYNWRNRKNESGSSDTPGLQNPEAGGSTLRIRQEPIIEKSWQPKSHHRQMPLPFKPSKFRQPYKNPMNQATTETSFYLISGESDEDRRKRLYGMNVYSIDASVYSSAANPATGYSSIQKL